MISCSLRVGFRWSTSAALGIERRSYFPGASSESPNSFPPDRFALRRSRAWLKGEPARRLDWLRRSLLCSDWLFLLQHLRPFFKPMEKFGRKIQTNRAITFNRHRICSACKRFVSCLLPQNVTFVANQRKFWELIDSWHKDCQQASSLSAINNKVWSVPTNIVTSLTKICFVTKPRVVQYSDKFSYAEHCIVLYPHNNRLTMQYTTENDAIQYNTIYNAMHKFVRVLDKYDETILRVSSYEPGQPGWLGFRDLVSPLFSL